MVLIQEYIQTSLVDMATALLQFLIALIRLDWLMILKSVWTLMLYCSASDHVSISVLFLVPDSENMSTYARIFILCSNYLCTLFSPIARSCYSSSQDILYSAYVTTPDGRRGYIGRPVTCVNGQEATYCNNTISECILTISGDSYCVCVYQSLSLSLVNKMAIYTINVILSLFKY